MPLLILVLGFPVPPCLCRDSSDRRLTAWPAISEDNHGVVDMSCRIETMASVSVARVIVIQRPLSPCQAALDDLALLGRDDLLQDATAWNRDSVD